MWQFYRFFATLGIDMSLARIKETFLRLPRHTKLIGVGSLILAVSTLLPWYADLDSYKIGDEFLGVTGPASFVGIVVILFSGFSFWIFLQSLLQRRMRRLPVREGIIHLAVATESLFLLVLVNSIYFHPKFGVNITLKESRFGMTIAFAGAIILLIGGYLQNREEIAKEGDTGRLEPLIKMEPTEPRPHAPLARPAAAQQQPEPRKIFPQHSPTKGFLFGERSGVPQQRLMGASPSAPRPAEPQPKSEEEKTGKGDGSYMIRMDL